MYEISKTFSFDSSHRLNNNNLCEEENKEIFGKCNNKPSHGHTYKMIVYLRSNIVELENGMIMNFSELKKIVNKEIIDKFDHEFLNDKMPELNGLTTAENMCKLIYRKLKPLVRTLNKIELWETPTSMANYSEE